MGDKEAPIRIKAQRVSTAAKITKASDFATVRSAVSALLAEQNHNNLRGISQAYRSDEDEAAQAFSGAASAMARLDHPPLLHKKRIYVDT